MICYNITNRFDLARRDSREYQPPQAAIGGRGGAVTGTGPACGNRARKSSTARSAAGVCTSLCPTPSTVSQVFGSGAASKSARPRPIGISASSAPWKMKSGAVLWKDQVMAPAVAMPAVYSYKGKEYVVFVAGGNSIVKPQVGDEIVAYALP